MAGSPSAQLSPPSQDATGEVLLCGPRAAEELSGFSLRPAEPLLIADRYRIEGTLGTGGTADVYLAFDEVREQLVVVKVMKPEIAQSEELSARFLFEAHALERVDHPWVVKILEISDTGGPAHHDEPPFLVLEALPGESLGDYLKRHGSMPAELALRLLRQAAVALGAVHRAGLVHRDVKPDNIYLVGPLDEPTHVKVLDFGMAHAVDHGHDDNSTSILGTAQYMAPEQILVEPVDERTDVYGLGVVLFRAVTGHLPFDDVKNKHHLLRHQLFSPVPPASWLREDLSLPLERLIHRSTRKAPAARFANMQEMVAAFDRALEAEDVCQNELDDPAIAEDAAELALGLELQVPVDPDVYVPLSSKGQRAAEVLAIEFGIYSRPQRTWSMESRAVESRSANHGGLESGPVDSRSVDSRSVDSSG